MYKDTRVVWNCTSKVGAPERAAVQTRGREVIVALRPGPGKLGPWVRFQNSIRRSMCLLRAESLPSFSANLKMAAVERIPRTALRWLLIHVVCNKLARNDVVFRPFIAFEIYKYVDVAGGLDPLIVLSDQPKTCSLSIGLPLHGPRLLTLLIRD